MGFINLRTVDLVCMYIIGSWKFEAAATSRLRSSFPGTEYINCRTCRYIQARRRGGEGHIAGGYAL